MAKARRKLIKAVQKEQADLQAQAAKRKGGASLWGTLGGLIAGGLTGGLASPLIAGLASGAGTYVGGKLGAEWSGVSKRDLKKGRFFKGERESVLKSIDDSIGASALKSGLTAGLMQFGGSVLKAGKGGGIEVATSTGGKTAEGVARTGGGISDTLSNIWKSGDKAKLTERYGPGFSLGKAMDIKGSFLGERFEGLKSSIAANQAKTKIQGLADQGGWIDPNLQGVVGEGGSPVLAMDRRIHSPIAKSAAVDKMLKNRGPLGVIPSHEDVITGAASVEPELDLAKFGDGVSFPIKPNTARPQIGQFSDRQIGKTLRPNVPLVDPTDSAELFYQGVDRSKLPNVPVDPGYDWNDIREFHGPPEAGPSFTEFGDWDVSSKVVEPYSEAKTSWHFQGTPDEIDARMQRDPGFKAGVEKYYPNFAKGWQDRLFGGRR